MGLSTRQSALIFSSFYFQFLIITSIFNKSQEFHTWLVEERKINPETVNKDQSKKEFAKFVEDFNTGRSCRTL